MRKVCVVLFFALVFFPYNAFGLVIGNGEVESYVKDYDPVSVSYEITGNIGGLSGTWTAIDTISLLTVKVFDQTVLFYPNATSGAWNVGDITNGGGKLPKENNIKLTGWVPEETTPAGALTFANPITSSLLLLSTGLVGLAAFRRKRAIK